MWEAVAAQTRAASGTRVAEVVAVRSGQPGGMGATGATWGCVSRTGGGGGGPREAGRHSVPRRGRRLASDAGGGGVRGATVNYGAERGGRARWSGSHGGRGGLAAIGRSGRGVAAVIRACFQHAARPREQETASRGQDITCAIK